MKSVLVVEDNGQGLEDALRTLRELDYSVTDTGPESPDELRFTRFAIDRACIQAFWLTRDQRIIYVNDEACRSLGYTRDELTGMKVGDIDPFFPGSESEEFAEHWRLLKEIGHARFETSHRANNGRVYPVEIRSNFLEFEGMEYSCSFATDISERKRAEELLRSSLAEKTVLLKEVHHRVKNNLQIICALLELQSFSITDKQSLAYFRDSQDRIRSMALVHEQLYRSGNFASIDFADYMENLTACLFDSHVKDTGRISLEVNAEHVSLNIDLSIPCGMIINELVANALKHAFPGGRKGRVVIGLNADKEGWITLTVADTGVGFPPGTDIVNAPTLGLQIVGMLVKQLKGEIELRNVDGASCVVRFRGAMGE